jgi:hypothetical protein
MRDDILTVDVPMTFRRRGGRKIIVAPDGSTMLAAAPRFQIDHALTKALARGFRWRKLLDNGTYSTIREIAAKERVDTSYIAERLRLTLLAPDIIEMILDGWHSPQCHVRLWRTSLPPEWETQRTLLRVPTPRELSTSDRQQQGLYR